MPKLPKEALSNMLKASKPPYVNLKLGSSVSFTITGPHTVGVGNLFSIPVVDNDGNSGGFPLNKTHAAMFVETLGDDTDDWVNTTFDAIVGLQNNPQAGAQVRSWVVDKASIKKRVTKHVAKV